MSFDQRQPRPRKNRRGTKFIASGSVVRPGAHYRGPGHAGLWDISPAARRESPVPPEGRSDSALPETSSIPTPGADGRTGAGQPIHTRRVQGTHPGSTVWEAGIVARSALQGPHTPLPPILSCWHPGTDGAAAGGIPLPGATGHFVPGEKCHGTLPAMFAGRKTGRGQRGPARLEALVTARRDVGTPAGLESGGNAEASYA